MKTERPIDAVNPSHYREESKVECIDAMVPFLERMAAKYFPNLSSRMGFGAVAVVMMAGFCFGNMFKYLYRTGKKQGAPPDVDVSKAGWYVQMGLHRMSPTQYLDPRDSRWDGRNASIDGQPVEPLL